MASLTEERRTVDAYARRFLTKCVHIILKSRVPQQRLIHDATVDKWFNFEVGEVEAAQKTLEEWRKTPQRPICLHILYNAANSEERRILEQWRFEYESTSTNAFRPSSSYQDAASALYKNMMVVTRALYAYLRLMPVYTLYRQAQGGEAPFELDFTFLEQNGVSSDDSWNQVVSMEICGGKLTVHVFPHDISDLLQPPPKWAHPGVDRKWDMCRVGMTSSVARLAQEWVHFVPKSREMKTRFYNPVTKHFKTSYESVKSAVSTLVTTRNLKKAWSLPRSHRTPQTETPSEDAIVCEFIQLLKEMPVLELEAADMEMSKARALLAQYQEKAQGAESKPTE